MAVIPILEVCGVTVVRGKTTLLENVTWVVWPGEHWAILGANGSGKTSLLRVLNACLSPSSGEIRVFGQIYGQTDWRELRASIGIVSTSIANAMNDGEPALESVIGGKYAMIDFWGDASPEDVREAEEILRRVEASHLAKRSWQFLSQGERQRVLIGRAFMAKPRLLILDEPCAGLDPVAREHFLHFLDRLGQQPNAPSIVLVTHHVEELVPALSHALILRRGRTLAVGPRVKILTSRNLTEAFGANIRLRQRRSRYSLEVDSTTHSSVL
jgi:iron complex transport system ATP-binding protein